MAKWPNLFKKSNFRDIKLKFSPEIDFNHRNSSPWSNWGSLPTLGRYLENQPEISQNYKKPNFHVVTLIFGLWIAGCELLTDFE